MAHCHRAPGLWEVPPVCSLWWLTAAQVPRAAEEEDGPCEAPNGWYWELCVWLGGT